MDHRRRVDHALVERLRSIVTASVAAATKALLRLGGVIDAAADELCAELGVVRHSSEVVAEAEGVHYLNPEMPSGYQGVRVSGTGRFFEASTSQLGKHISLGKFPTAVEAAVAYARYRATRRSVGKHQRRCHGGECGERLREVGA